MTNAERVSKFLTDAKVFFFLTANGDRPKGRPFGFQMLDNDTVYFGTGTFKKVYAELQANPEVEVLALCGEEFLRYDGKVKFVQSDELLAKVRAAMPDMMAIYDQNGWEMALFCLENGHAELHTMMGTKEEFDV